MESLILDIRALKSGMLSVITLSFCHLNNLEKVQIKHYCKLLTELFINNSNFKFLSSASLSIYFILHLFSLNFLSKLRLCLCVCVFVN